MSDFIEVGKISNRTLTRTISFSCAGKINPAKLPKFQKDLLALLARYGLKCVPTYGVGGARRAKAKSAAKKKRASRGARKTR
jgi:hypothetical protein